MSVQDVFVSDLTAEEAAAGFAVCPVEHPDGSAAVVPAVTHTWGDPSHRLVKTRGRDGAVFQLQAFGRRRAGAGNGPLGGTPSGTGRPGTARPGSWTASGSTSAVPGTVP